MSKRIIAFYTKFASKGASSRYRTLQYILDEDSKIKDGFVHRPLFDNRYLSIKYKTGRTPMLIAGFSYIKRLGYLINDVFLGRDIYIEKELFPYFPPFVEVFFKMVGVKYILDYDDAVWHNYDSHNRFIIRLFLSNKIKTVIRCSSGVIAGNKYIRDYVVNSGQSKVIKIPTVIPKESYLKSDQTKPVAKEFIVVWVGSPSSSDNLLEVKDVLRAFKEKYPSVIIAFLGFDKRLEKEFNFGVEFITWSTETEKKWLNNASVGIMPLKNGNFEKGKCGFKIIQYMASAIPSIVTPIGANNEIVKHNKTGFKAIENKQWEEFLEICFNNTEFSKEIGDAAYKEFLLKYSLESTESRYFNFIEEALNNER